MVDEFVTASRPPSLIGRLVPVGLFGALAAGTLSAFIRTATGGFTYSSGWSERSIFDSTILVPVVLLAASAVVLAVSRSVFAHRAAFVVGFAASAQIAGTGAVAYRRWLTASGFTVEPDNFRTMRGLAASLVIGGLACATTAVLALWGDRSSYSPPARHLAVGAVGAAIVAIAVPLAMGSDPDSGRATALSAHALMYGIPWALGLMISVWSGRRTDVIGLGATLLTVVAVTADSEVMIPAPSLVNGGLIAAVAMVAAVLITLLIRRPAHLTTPEPAG